VPIGLCELLVSVHGEKGRFYLAATGESMLPCRVVIVLASDILYGELSCSIYSLMSKISVDILDVQYHLVLQLI
jgi:hypothetical protein